MTTPTDTSREAVRPYDEQYETMKDVEQDPTGAIMAIHALVAESDTLRAQLAAAKDLPWRAKDIKRGLILFRTSSNAHGSINYQARSEKVDNLPQSAKDELAAIMVNMALGYSQEDVAANGTVKEWLKAARNAALEEAFKHFEPDELDSESTRAHCEYAQREIRALKSTPVMRCAECDCANGGSDCTWIAASAPREVTPQEAARVLLDAMDGEGPFDKILEAADAMNADARKGLGAIPMLGSALRAIAQEGGE